MTNNTLKRKTGVALFWSFIDKGGQQFIQFIFFYFLSRLIVKEDFGLVAVLAVFTAVANILQESGFSSALIRKKNVSPQEYSAVFYFNILVSCIIYGVLFVFAPFIGEYYHQPVLTGLSRFIFLSFVCNAFAIIQNVNLVKDLNFKANTRITLLAGCISGIVATIMAYKGFGVWSLAAQQVVQSFLRSVFLWLYVKWKPLRHFSFIHIKEMSSYSIKLLLTSLMNQICANIIPLILAKKYSFSAVASYGQGYKLSSIPQAIISDGIKNVTYPLISSVGEDLETSKKIFRKIIRIASFISFPVSCLLIVLAEPVVDIYLPSGWEDTIPILQILAIGGAFYPLYNLMGALLQYSGQSGRYFSIEFVRNAILILSIFLTVGWGVIGLVTGISIARIFTFFVNVSVSGQAISYSVREVLSDIFPYIVISCISFLPMMFLKDIGINNLFLRFMIPILLGSTLYLLIIKILGSVIIQDTIDFLVQLRKKRPD